MKKAIFIFAVLLSVCNSVFGQFFVNDTMLDTLFNKRVKSLDEFMARFNGDENFSEISPDDPNVREKNILALFEKDSLLAHQEKFGSQNELFSSITDFINNVANNNRRLDLEKDSMIFAVADMKVKYAAKDNDIKIILTYETVGNEIYGWKLAGVSGLVESGIIDTSTVRIFRPVDNEMNFSALVEIVNSPKNQITQYRSFSVCVDQLSYFMALAALNKISITRCTEVSYHILSIEGYAFVVSKFNKIDKNNGWLISKFQKLDNAGKDEYINKLLGKNEN